MEKVTKEAAVVSVITGTVVVVLTYYVFDVGDIWYGFFGCLTSFICMIIVSFITYKNRDKDEFFDLLQEVNNHFIDKEKQK